MLLVVKTLRVIRGLSGDRILQTNSLCCKMCGRIKNFGCNYRNSKFKPILVLLTVIMPNENSHL